MKSYCRGIFVNLNGMSVFACIVTTFDPNREVFVTSEAWILPFVHFWNKEQNMWNHPSHILQKRSTETNAAIQYMNAGYSQSSNILRVWRMLVHVRAFTILKCHYHLKHLTTRKNLFHCQIILFEQIFSFPFKTAWVAGVAKKVTDSFSQIQMFHVGRRLDNQKLGTKAIRNITLLEINAILCVTRNKCALDKLKKAQKGHTFFRLFIPDQEIIHKTGSSKLLRGQTLCSL